MMGNDCERILKGICDFKDTLTNKLIELSNSTSYQMYQQTDYVHSTDSYGYVRNGSHGEYYEKKKNISVSGIVTALNDIKIRYTTDLNNIDKLEHNLFAETADWNNSYGSPWTEIQKLTSIIEVIISFAKSHPNLEYLGDKVALLNLLSTGVALAVDAKTSFLSYHDYIQRGYDYNFNNKTSTVTTARVDKNNPIGIGNVNQIFDENVNVELPTLDPF